MGNYVIWTNESGTQYAPLPEEACSTNTYELRRRPNTDSPAHDRPMLILLGNRLFVGARAARSEQRMNQFNQADEVIYWVSVRSRIAGEFDLDAAMTYAETH